MNSTGVWVTRAWLSFYFLQLDFFNQGMSEGDTQIINDDLYLLCIDRPTLHFNKHVVVIYKKTECAHILFDTRNEKFFAKDICKVEFVNHTLYSGVWIDAVSYTHLDVYKRQLKKGSTMPTLLPAAAFFLGIQYQPARKIIDAGLPVALALSLIHI